MKDVGTSHNKWLVQGKDMRDESSSISSLDSLGRGSISTAVAFAILDFKSCTRWYSYIVLLLTSDMKKTTTIEWKAGIIIDN